jgi:hypothetical protein
MANFHQQGDSEATEPIRLRSRDTFRDRDVPDALAVIDPRSPYNTITLQELTHLLGQVQYVRDGTNNPHQPRGLVGTKLLEVEHVGIPIMREEVFCIVTEAAWPIVLNRSMKRRTTPREIFVIAGSALSKEGMYVLWLGRCSFSVVRHAHLHTCLPTSLALSCVSTTDFTKEKQRRKEAHARAKERETQRAKERKKQGGEEDIQVKEEGEMLNQAAQAQGQTQTQTQGQTQTQTQTPTT